MAHRQREYQLSSDLLSEEDIMILGKIDHMDFTVGDLKKTQEYLVKKLGFTFLRRNEHEDKSISVELTSPASDFVIQIHEASQEELRMRREQPEFPLYFNHIAFKVDNIDESFKALKNKGVSFRRTAPTLNPVTGRTLANALDDAGRPWIQLTD